MPTPRKPTIRYFASKNGYYTSHERTRYRPGDGPGDVPPGPNFRSRHKDRWSQEAVSANISWYAKGLDINPAANLDGPRLRSPAYSGWACRKSPPTRS